MPSQRFTDWIKLVRLNDSNDIFHAPPLRLILIVLQCNVQTLCQNRGSAEIGGKGRSLRRYRAKGKAPTAYILSTTIYVIK